MYLLLMFFCVALFLTGAAVCLISLGKYTSYVETEGEVLDFLQCNPYEQEDRTEKVENNKESAVVVAYRVNGRTYHLATNLEILETENPPAQVKVLYDPYFPAQSQLKEGSPFLGVVLLLVSIASFILLQFFF